MARQVNFDPFGSYLQGLRLGQQDEMGLQQATRQARMQDYNFNTLAPLQLEQMQMGIDYDRQANPMRLDAMGQQNFATDLGIAGTYGQETGNLDPRARLWEQQYGIPAAQYPVDAGRQFLNQDQTNQQQQYLLSQMGMEQRGANQQLDAQQSAQYRQFALAQSLIQSGIPPQMIPQMLQYLQGGQGQPQPSYGQGQGVGYQAPQFGGPEQDDRVGSFDDG